VKFTEGEVVIPDETIRHLIDKHTSGEQGVRNLKRCLEIVHTKLNLYRLMKPGSNLFKKDMDLEVAFPFTVTKDVVDTLIQVEKRAGAWQSMYM
jgi:ATP-dependent Lon protease